jgi:Asp-tRNA(Asn)/Glu-tRNA(Gln) amidotransferase A subunit family amidase
MDPSFHLMKRPTALVRRGEIGCFELSGHFIARQERLDGRTNAVVMRNFDRARKRARTPGRRRKQGTGKKLFGVPMTVKKTPKAASLSSWPHMAATASPQSFAAARRSSYSRIARSRCWCIAEPRRGSAKKPPALLPAVAFARLGPTEYRR